MEEKKTAAEIKEFRVKLEIHENDDYVEVWKVIVKKNEKKRYFARYTYGEGEWFFVADPHGYCELDSRCPDNYVFIVCDQNGKELFRSCNGDDSRKFPPLRVLAKQKFAEFAKEHPEMVGKKALDTSLELYLHWATGELHFSHDKWLLTFKDPDIYGDEARDYDENWCYCRWEETGKKVLAKFDYVGDTYTIERQDLRHTICGKKWSEISSAGWLMATIFDESDIGTMANKTEAIKAVADMLKELYPEAKYALSYARTVYGDYVYEERLPFSKAAELVINRDFHTRNIERILTEREKAVGIKFYETTMKLEAAHPDARVIWDNKNL